MQQPQLSTSKTPSGFKSRKIWFRCRRKIRHADFWAAAKHYFELKKHDPYCLIEIYYCRFCEGLHLGNKKTLTELKGIVRKLETIMSHPNFWLKAPQDVQIQMTSRLKMFKDAVQ